MHPYRLLTTCFILVLLLIPSLQACQGQPAQPVAPPAAATVAQEPTRPDGRPASQIPGANATAAVSTPTREPLPPSVVSLTPGRGESQVLSAPVVITFDQPMDAASTSSAFSIEPNVPGDVRVQGNELVFSPKEKLKRAAEYRVSLDATAANSTGLRLGQPVSFKFTTAGYLQVSNTQPVHGGPDVPVDARLIVAFDRPVTALSGMEDAAPGPLVITPTVAGKGEWLTTSIYQFTPALGLDASTDYSVTVKAGLEDTTGGLLAEPYTFEFRTTDPTLLGWSAEAAGFKGDADKNVRIESPITVTFSMPMNRVSTEAAFSVVGPGRTPVPGSFTWGANDTVLGFKPTRALGFGANYTASVADAARPAQGQGHLRAADEHIFSTVLLPMVTLTSPADGDGRAAPNGGVRFTFASPMDTATFVTGTVKILPAPTGVYTNYNQWDNSLYVGFDELPATAYTATLSGKVGDPYGNLLGQDQTVRFTTRDYDPLMQLSGVDRIGTYNAYTNTQAMVLYRNVPEVNFELYSTSVPDFIALSGQNSWDTWDKYNPDRKDLLDEWAIKTSAGPNKIALLRTDLEAGGKQLPPGIYFLQIGSGAPKKGEERLPVRQLLARTDLNVTLKSSGQEALAWVTDLKSGQPVPGATVRFTDGKNLDLRAATDADGVARVTFSQQRHTWEPLLALASTDAGGFGVASSQWEQGINPWDFGVQGGMSTVRYNGYVYTDRPIYRPGQTVHWKALVRRDRDAAYSLPAAGQPVTVTIMDDQGNQLINQHLTLGPTGTLDGQLALSVDAGLGNYYVSVQIDEARPPTEETVNFGVNFQVAEYRKPEYEVSAQTGKPEYIQGEQISTTLQANYFFGGPVKNGRVSWVLLSDDYAFDYRGKEQGFSFADWDWYDRELPRPFGQPLSQGEGVTDAEGRMTFNVPADISKFSQSQRFTFDITILDANNQNVSTQASAVVHKGALYVGLRPQEYVAVAGKSSLVDVLAVDTASQPVAGTEITLVANRINWYSVREQAEDGNFYWTSRAEKTPVYTTTVTTDDAGAGVFRWTPDEGGEFKIEAVARDRGAHTIRSAAFVWASGSDYVNWRQENNDRIELVADKDTYTAGETAQVLVASPYQGPVKALLTVERDNVLSHEVVDLTGNSQVLPLKISSEHAPNIYVSVVLVKGMDAVDPLPSFKMGLKQLKVSVADKQLQIVLTPHAAGSAAEADASTPLRVGPRDKVTWDVRTLDAAGQAVQAEVSLALVDKAVLSLADDNAGKLMDRFYSQRAPGVRTASTLVVNVDRMIAQATKSGKGGGGGGGGGGPLSVRRELPDIAYWNAVVNTGATGKAQVEVTLPDNLTTWTMDARAITPDTLVGQQRTDIIATKDLLVRPVLPRFFVQGDQAQLAGIVHNNTKQPLSVTIDLKATGLATPAETQTRVTIEPGSTYKAVWPVQVLPGAEEVKVLMSAVAGGPSSAGATLDDAVEQVLPVHHYSTPEVVGTSGVISEDGQRLELFRLPPGADPARGGLNVMIEPSLAAGMTGGLTYLEHFPYECIEQTVSRFLPNVVSYQALQKLGIARPDLQTVLAQQVGVGVQRIYAQQHIDGGWGWWQTDASSPAVTAYVVLGLARARQAGFTVDQNVVDRGVRFLRQSLDAPPAAGGTALEKQLNEQAFTVYVLAEAGDAQPGRAGALFEKREGLSLFGHGYLALALGLIDDAASHDRIKTLLSGISSEAITSATTTHWEEGWTDHWNMNTDTRTTSILLNALAKLDPKNPLAPNAVRWLMNARRADRWETTQENSWAIMALTDWMAATGELEGDYTWEALLNGQSFGAGRVEPQNVGQATSLQADIGKLLARETNRLLLQRSTGPTQSGKGQMYYSTYLKSYEPVEQVEPLDRGIAVTREYRLADCGLPPPDPSQAGASQECPPITSAKVGDVIEVRLTLVVPDTMLYLAVEDPLPAGVEAIDTSLRTTSRTAQGPGMQQVKQGAAGQGGDWRWNWWWSPTHTELRDEKVALFATTLDPGTYQFSYQVRASLPGRFLTLPPSAYEMYSPEVWGRGAGGAFTVTD